MRRIPTQAGDACLEEISSAVTVSRFVLKKGNNKKVKWRSFKISPQYHSERSLGRNTSNSTKLKTKESGNSHHSEALHETNPPQAVAGHVV